MKKIIKLKNRVKEMIHDGLKDNMKTNHTNVRITCAKCMIDYCPDCFTKCPDCK